jgi:hypothetical protein
MMIVTDETVKQQWYDYLTNEYDLQAIVLAHYLVEGDNRPDYDEAQSDFDSEDYFVYTDEEADEAVRENIEEMVWAFNPSFLQAHTDVDSKAFNVLQGSMCEDANEAIKAMIKDFDHFVDDAVACDGRGHFLDVNLEENEITFNGITYYIYRRN